MKFQVKHPDTGEWVDLDTSTATPTNPAWTVAIGRNEDGSLRVTEDGEDVSGTERGDGSGSV